MNVLAGKVRALALICALCVGMGNRATSAPLASMGQNFTASTYNVNVTSLPPDVNGVAGPHHFVEFVNGSFAVFNKTNGQSLKRITDLQFWANAGVVIATDAATTDPRIIYDPASQRWFASMVDANATATDPTLLANNFLLAVSAGPDPTGAWHGFLFEADPANGYFADFPTLGVDSDAVYLSGDLYQGQNNPIGPGLVSIPKRDLLAANPTIANRTWFGALNYAQRGQVLQPAVCLDGSATGAILALTDIGNDSDPHSNLVSFAVQNAGLPGAALTTAAFVTTPPWMVPYNADMAAPLFTPVQPDGTSALQANDARLGAFVYAVGGILYAVHNTELNNRIAIRWYRLRATDHALLEAGTISDPDLDLFFPSIAANAAGVVVLSFNGSGLGTAISCFALVGQTVNGATTFGPRLLLQTGATSYHGDDELLAQLLGQPAFSRWGDYSTTSVDPSDPNRFWSIQMFPSDGLNSDVWSTQVTELVTVPGALLAILPSGNSLSLSWSISFAGYQLQTASDLAPATLWSPVTLGIQTNGTQLTVTVPVSAGQHFFRLHIP